MTYISILPRDTVAGDVLADGREIVSRLEDSRYGNPRALIRDYDGYVSTLEWCSRETRIDVRRTPMFACGHADAGLRSETGSCMMPECR